MAGAKLGPWGTRQLALTWSRVASISQGKREFRSVCKLSYYVVYEVKPTEFQLHVHDMHAMETPLHVHVHVTCMYYIHITCTALYMQLAHVHGHIMCMWYVHVQLRY